MKKNLFIFLLLLISLISKAQKYTPFNFKDGEWYCSYYSKNGIITSSYTKYIDEQVKFYCNGDTIIYNNLYQKLYYEGYAKTNSVYSISGYLAAIREDTINKQVWYYRDGFELSLLYDFNLQIGDSIFYDNAKYPILSIDSVNYCGTYHKRYNAIASQNYPISQTEGIGGNYGLITFPSFAYFPQGNLRCYSEKNNSNCKNACGLPLNVNKIKAKQVKLYPNPSAGLINIESEFPIESIKITDVLGKIILEENVKFLLKTEINMEQSGVYILEIKTSEGISNTKFIKK